MKYITELSNNQNVLPQAWVSLVAQTVKHLPAMQKTWVQPLDQEGPLEKEMATLSSILAWRILMHRRAWWTTIHWVTKSQTQLSDQHTHHHHHHGRDVLVCHTKAKGIIGHL